MRVKAMGRTELLPDSIIEVLKKLDDATKNYDRHYLSRGMNGKTKPGKKLVHEIEKLTDGQVQFIWNSKEKTDNDSYRYLLQPNLLNR